jgi:hypothetical protein
MPENINSIIKESIKIAKEKLSQEIAKLEEKENADWGDYWQLQRNTEKDLKEQDMTLSEQDEIIKESWEKSIESLSKKNDFESLSNIYDLYSDFEFYRNIGDHGLTKMQKAAEYADKAGAFGISARFKAHAAMIQKRLELKQRGKDIVQWKWRNGAVELKKADNIILSTSSFANCFGDDTDFNIFGELLPLYDLNWIPDRNGWQQLCEYKDADLAKSWVAVNSDNRIHKILFSKHPETVKVGDKVYEGCLHVIYRRELDGETGDRYFDRYKTDSVWYAPDVGIIKINRTTQMEEKRTYYLDDYKVNGEGMGNKYMPLAEGNWWSYKAEGDNAVDITVYDYINKFTVTHANGDEAAVSHLGWIYER